MDEKEIIERYKEKVKQFLDELKKINLKDIEKFTVPHLPGFGEKYPSSDKRVLYIGIETNGWYTFGQMGIDDEAIEKYIQSSINCIKGYKFLIWLPGSAFWEFILKLQLKLYGIDYEEFDKTLQQPKDLKEVLDDIHKNFGSPLQSFVWANASSIESYKDVEKENDKKKWKTIKKLSEEKFDKLRIMVEILKPRVAIILNGGVSKAFWDNEVKWEEQKNIPDMFIKCCNYNNTQLIWTYHPSYMKRKKLLDKYVEEIFKLIPNKLQDT